MPRHERHDDEALAALIATLTHDCSSAPQDSRHGPAPQSIVALTQACFAEHATLHEAAAEQSIFASLHALAVVHVTLHDRPGGHAIVALHAPAQTMLHVEPVQLVHTAGQVALSGPGREPASASVAASSGSSAIEPPSTSAVTVAVVPLRSLPRQARRRTVIRKS